MHWSDLRVGDAVECVETGKVVLLISATKSSCVWLNVNGAKELVTRQDHGLRTSSLNTGDFSWRLLLEAPESGNAS